MHELEKRLAHAQNTLMEKEAELEKLQRATKDLEANLQEAKQGTSKVDCEALRAEVQKLKDTLEETKEQLKLAGETRACPATLSTLSPQRATSEVLLHTP